MGKIIESTRSRDSVDPDSEKRGFVSRSVIPSESPTGSTGAHGRANSGVVSHPHAEGVEIRLGCATDGNVSGTERMPKTLDAKSKRSHRP